MRELEGIESSLVVVRELSHRDPPAGREFRASGRIAKGNPRGGGGVFDENLQAQKTT